MKDNWDTLLTEEQFEDLKSDTILFGKMFLWTACNRFLIEKYGLDPLDIPAWCLLVSRGLKKKDIDFIDKYLVDHRSQLMKEIEWV